MPLSVCFVSFFSKQSIIVARVVPNTAPTYPLALKLPTYANATTEGQSSSRQRNSSSRRQGSLRRKMRSALQHVARLVRSKVFSRWKRARKRASERACTARCLKLESLRRLLRAQSQCKLLYCLQGESFLYFFRGVFSDFWSVVIILWNSRWIHSPVSLPPTPSCPRLNVCI
jgi:hypothetical protein